MSGKKKYSVEVKLEAVRQFLEGGQTRAEIAKALGLRGASRVRDWVWRYRREGELAFRRSIGRPRKVWDDRARIRQLEMEIALLKKYHTELRKSLLARRNIGSPTTTGRTTK